MRLLDSKFHIDGDRIIKSSSGEEVPPDEPLFLLRARDHLALPILRAYRQACVDDGCNEFQLSGMDETCRLFVRYPIDHPEMMKQPGVTKGLPWVPRQYARPDWDPYFLAIAVAVSSRADCRRARHGAVIVGTDRRIVSTGYNGGVSGGPSCLAGECPRGLHSRSELPGSPEGNHDFSDCISLHAEQNAIAYADRSRTAGGTIYITGAPCDMCGKLIQAAGIERVVTV